MRTWVAVALLGTCVVAALGSERTRGPASGLVAVSDAEAAKLYGGGFDALVDGNKCSGTGTGCKETSCYYSLEAGTREGYVKNCGSCSCGSVVGDNGPCTGG